MLESKIVEGDFLATLVNCGGYYEAPPGGHLVGYAGTYPGPDGQPRQFVGRVYVNFAQGEQYPPVLDEFAKGLAALLDQLEFSVLLGAPLGGLLLASATGFYVPGVRVIFAEKQVFALATEHGRELSRLELKRHELHSADRVVLVEDVCNNFSTTEELIKVVEKWGARVAGIACFLNRSGLPTYRRQSGAEIPVFALENRPIQQWRQDDPEAADDIAAGNIIWKPKAEWPRLMAAMQQIQKGKQ